MAEFEEELARYKAAVNRELTAEDRTFVLNELINQDVSVHGNGLLFQDTLPGVVLLPGDKEHTALGPSPKELVIDIPLIDHHN